MGRKKDHSRISFQNQEIFVVLAIIVFLKKADYLGYLVFHDSSSRF